MKRIHQATSVVCAGLGAFLVYQGHRLGLEGQLGPGPGFFPFGIGVALAALSLTWLARVSLGPSPAMAADFVPARPRLLVLAIVVSSLVAFMLLLRPLGFNLAMLALLLGLFFTIDRKFPIAKIVIAFLGSFGVHHVFEQILKVPLPFASLPFLARLGF